MKKGFSIIELTISLIVIGIILGIVVKSMSLMEDSAFMRDFSRIHKISISLYAYNDITFHHLPIKSQNALTGVALDYDDIISQGYLQQSDFESKVYEDLNLKYALTWCHEYDGGTGSSTDYFSPYGGFLFYRDYRDMNLCLITDFTDAPASAAASYGGFFFPFICMYETRSDDSDGRFGTGRSFVNQSSSTQPTGGVQPGATLFSPKRFDDILCSDYFHLTTRQVANEAYSYQYAIRVY